MSSGPTANGKVRPDLAGEAVHHRVRYPAGPRSPVRPGRHPDPRAGHQQPGREPVAPRLLVALRRPVRFPVGPRLPVRDRPPGRHPGQRPRRRL
ncbi:hypothetical protein ACN27F_14500 [Solwaraspora sp. WMMB335]|uniref:hypothetical protein n=1 Tax=Solwaraspora sp. WMMB335 TaxID=3404118 RepID=UPI003B946C92